MAKNNNQNKARQNHSVGQFQKQRNTEEFSQELGQQEAQQSTPSQGNKKHKK